MAPQEREFEKIIREIDMDYLTDPDTSGLEKLTKEEALHNFRQYEKEGLCHTVWTFVDPFIGGICNCDRSDCGAMRSTVVQNYPVMFRAEYVTEVNPELCNGCRVCMRVCQLIAKACWNIFLIEGDASAGIHNPSFTLEVLNATLTALK